MQGQINTLHGYFSSSVETNHSMCRRIITNIVTHAIVEPSEFASDKLDELLTSVVKNTKYFSASVNITRFKLCSVPKYAIHFIVGGKKIIIYPVKIKITQLFQKQGVITQLTKTLSVALLTLWGKSASYICNHTIICHCGSSRLPTAVCLAEGLADDHNRIFKCML